MKDQLTMTERYLSSKMLMMKVCNKILDRNKMVTRKRKRKKPVKEASNTSYEALTLKVLIIKAMILRSRCHLNTILSR